MALAEGRGHLAVAGADHAPIRGERPRGQQPEEPCDDVQQLRAVERALAWHLDPAPSQRSRAARAPRSCSPARTRTWPRCWPHSPRTGDHRSAAARFWPSTGGTRGHRRSVVGATGIFVAPRCAGRVRRPACSRRRHPRLGRGGPAGPPDDPVAEAGRGGGALARRAETGAPGRRGDALRRDHPRARGGRAVGNDLARCAPYPAVGGGARQLATWGTPGHLASWPHLRPPERPRFGLEGSGLAGTRHRGGRILAWSSETPEPLFVAGLVGRLAGQPMLVVADQELRGLLAPEVLRAWSDASQWADRLIVLADTGDASALALADTARTLATEPAGLTAVVVD
jgi:hypothetical protein